MSQAAFVLFTLGPVQRFIEAARSLRDLWSGSYLISYLTFRAMKAVADAVGREAIVFPDYTGLPLARWQPGSRADHAVLQPCIPNRFLAEVPGERGWELAHTAERECRAAWKQIADHVRDLLERHTPRGSLDPYQLWDHQIDCFFETYTAVLPQAEYTPDRIRSLLGNPSGREWADRHQIAQMMLATVKNRRHFPVYAPPIPAGEVPQKDSLLGTLEHLGPGTLRDVPEFWQAATSRWLARGSRVARTERLSAVSLVKRFAWAHHFSQLFGLDPQTLRFADTATVAATNWLRADPPLKPESVRREHGDWSGQWLHWPSPMPPNDDLDEGEMPEPVWNVIQAKKKAQGRPPTYYAAFVFDGDRMGDRFNAAPDARTYRQISATLARFALERIEPIVKEHHGELIYAGGDDAICLLPTDTALACAAKICTAFRDNWRQGLAAVGEWSEQLPADLRTATISGGLAVAHHKEDLRYVLEAAREAEKQAKKAGRNALQVTVCRRSGEHSSARLPWDFVGTVSDWVRGFAAGASDRWTYKLRADLRVIGENREMFRLELGRQLDRAEQPTREHFAAELVQAAFDRYTGSILDFVTLLQTASFLARGRDA